MLLHAYAHTREQKKRRLSHDNRPFINLKSNTMKNTLQRYAFLGYLQLFLNIFSAMFRLFNQRGLYAILDVNRINTYGTLFDVQD